MTNFGGISPQDLLLSLQQGVCPTQPAAAPVQVVVAGPAVSGACCPSGATLSTTVDAHKLDASNDCEVRFNIANDAEGSAASRIYINKGTHWYAGYAAAIGLTPGAEGTPGVISNFDGNPQASVGSLVAWNTILQGILVNQICITKNDAGAFPKVSRITIDQNLGRCVKKVLAPLCEICPTDDDSNVKCYDVCAILDPEHIIMIEFAAGANFDVTLSTPASATAYGMTTCNH